MEVPGSTPGRTAGEMGPFVLIADFASPQRELLHALLVRNGFAVEVVGRSADALMRIYSRPVRLLICGLGLPNAEQVCAAAKAGVAETHTVLLAASGPLPQDGDTVWDATLSHPLRVDAFLALLEGWGIRPGPAVDPGPRHAVWRALPVPKPGSSAEPPPPPPPVPTGAPSAEPTGVDLELEDLSDPATLDGSGMVEVPPRHTTAWAPFAVLDRVAGGLPARGSIREFGLPHLIVRLYRNGFSGVLQLTRHGVERAVCFLAGSPVRVDSSQLSETLGQMLLGEGAITTAQLQQAQQFMETDQTRPGEALVGIGALTESGLIAAMQRQTENKLVNCFAWRDGDFSIQSDDSFAFNTLHCDVHPLRALWRGVNDYYDGLELAQGFAADEGSFIVATDLFPAHADLVRPPLAELGLWEMLDGRRTVREALDHRPAMIDRVAKALYLLQLIGVIELESSPGDAVELHDDDAPVEAAESAETTEPPPGQSDFAELIARHLLFLQGADLFAALRLEADADSEQVDAAYREQVALLRLRDPPPDLPSTTLKQVNEIRAILFRAWETLHDPARRREQVADPTPPTPRSPSVRVSMGAHDRAQRLLAQGDFRRARSVLEAAITENGTEPALRVALADAILGQAGPQPDRAELRLALSCLDQALFLDPSHVEASLKLAGLLLDSGRLELATDHLARVLRCAPDNQDAREMMHRLQISLAQQGPDDKERQQAPAEIRHRLKVRCREVGQKDAVGYTTTVARDWLFVNTRIVYPIGSRARLDLQLPIVGDITLEAEVADAKRTHRALSAIQLESGMRMRLLEVPELWQVFVASLQR